MKLRKWQHALLKYQHKKVSYISIQHNLLHLCLCNIVQFSFFYVFISIGCFEWKSWSFTASIRLLLWHVNSPNDRLIKAYLILLNVMCCDVLFPSGCFSEKGPSGGSANHVNLWTINPKLYSFPPRARLAQVRNPQSEIERISGTVHLINVRVQAINQMSVSQAALQDIQWWRQQSGGSCCPH